MAWEGRTSWKGASGNLLGDWTHSVNVLDVLSTVVTRVSLSKLIELFASGLCTLFYVSYTPTRGKKSGKVENR